MHLLLALTLLAASQATCSQVGITVGLSPNHYDPIESLYHSQHKSGQYLYGYATPTSTLSETKSADGVTRGGYSYIDSDGHLQTVHYTADALHGFQVAATNLPRESPEVVFARAKHVADYEAIRAEHAKLAVAYSNPVAVPAGAVPQIPLQQQLPQPVADLPEVVKARNEHLAILSAAYANSGVSAQQPVRDLPEVARARAEHLAAFERTRIRDETIRAQINLSPAPVDGVVRVRTQDSDRELPEAQNAERVAYVPAADGALGVYTYGYVGPLSSHSESRTPDGVTRGGYSFIDANGIVQTVHYTADAAHGFRVAASNIPIDVNHARRAVPAVPAAPAAPSVLYSQEILY